MIQESLRSRVESVLLGEIDHCGAIDVDFVGALLKYDIHVVHLYGYGVLSRLVRSCSGPPCMR